MNSLPVATGAYALVIRLERAFSGPVGALGPVDLPAGDYLYCGSAHGPGGLRARLRRHLCREKPVHWHVDRLTAVGAVTRIVAIPGGRECDLVARALGMSGITVPAPGFGSSDCRRCPAHLLGLPGGDARGICLPDLFDPV